MGHLISISTAVRRIGGGVSASKLRTMCQAGKIEGAIKIGKTWVIPEKAIDGILVRGPGRPRKM